MLGKRIINTATGAGAACTTDTVQILGDTSCVAYYKMSDATDETGSYDGTPTNVNFNVAGKFGNAGEFNGSSSYVSASNMLDTSSAFSYSLWIKPDTISSLDFLIGLQQAGSPYAGISLLGSGSNKLFLSISGGTAQDMTPSLSLNTWSHIVLTHDGSGNYVCYTNNNGSPISYSGATSNNSSNPFRIGFSSVSGWGYFEGKIDQIRIFDRAITSDEVTTLYNEVYCQPTIVPTDHFEPVLYTGNGSTQSISTLDFAPDFVWMKDRDTTNYEHVIFDSVRGTGTSHILSSDLTSQEGWSTNGSLTSFDSNGFTLPNTVLNNANGHNYVAWNWKAGGATVSNTDGTITSQVSANTDAGFSIVKTASETNGTIKSIGHGLNNNLSVIISKGLGTSSWNVWHKELGTPTIPGLNYLLLETSGSKGSVGGTGGRYQNVNTNTFDFNFYNQEMLFYCFAEVDGMSKFGSYVGTGAAGNSIVTGFRPAFVMIKGAITPNATNWWIFDNKRNPDNPLGKGLLPNSSSAEQPQGTYLDFNSNGFTWLSGNGEFNDSGNTFIYMAFAEENVQPQPVLANSFNTVTYTGNGGTQAINTVGFQPDLVWIKKRSSATNAGHMWFDSVRGLDKVIGSDRTNAEYIGGGNAYLPSFDTDGFSLTGNAIVNESSQSFVAWCWKASNDSTINQYGSITSIVSANPAAGFSVVKYTGNGTAGATVGHGIDTPELILVKNRNDSELWSVYGAGSASDELGETKVGHLNLTNTFSTTGDWNSTAPTSTVFTVGTSNRINSTDNYIAYCFHSVDGYQKVGSYSGSSSNVTVTTGFRPSWVMVKSTTGNYSWYIVDSERGATSSSSIALFANLSNAEASGYGIYFEDDGFVVSSGVGAGTNTSGNTYIYLAIKAN